MANMNWKAGIFLAIVLVLNLWGTCGHEVPRPGILHPGESSQRNTSDNSSHGEPHGVHVVSWNYEYVKMPLLLGIFLVVVAFLKLLFHYAEWLSSIIPESCLLIVFGVAVGAIFHFGFNITEFRLHPRMFMLFLLPPIVIDSAYSLNDRCFAENVGSVLVYAVIGTLFNFCAIGTTLFGLMKAGAMGSIDLNIVECLLFSSFIVAVDPVAVLAIFQEVGVNNVLYFLVFGESLMNDAVTVVIYNMMKAFNDMDTIPISQVFIGIASFFTISLGGALIGFILGILTCLFTKFTSHVRVVEPLAMFAFAYLSYLGAELFHWSGIISLIVCGLVQSQYAFHNISRKSNTTVKYFVKMISSTADAVIFLFLGFEVVSQGHIWHTGFVLWGVILCLFFRLISVFGLTAILNKIDQSRVKKIDLSEQFIMWYGGLRGAVCFALVATLRDDFRHRSLFITSSLVVIVFTVFVQGMTIKPLVKLFKIRGQEEKSSLMTVEVNDHVTDHLMSGMEVVIGYIWGEKSLRELIVRINDKYLRKWLQKDPLTQDQQIVQFYRKVAIKDHVKYIEGATHKHIHLSREDQEALISSGTTEPDELREADDIPEIQEPRPRLATITRQILRKKRVLYAMVPHKKGRSQQDNLLHDFRSAMKHSNIRSFHHTYDPNLTRDEDTDFLHHLQQKHARSTVLHRRQLRRSQYSRVQSANLDQEVEREPISDIRRAMSEGASPEEEFHGQRSPPLNGEPAGKKVSFTRPVMERQDEVSVEMAPFLEGKSVEGVTNKTEESEA